MIHGRAATSAVGEFERSNDALLVVVDRFLKMVRAIPCSTDVAAEELGYILVEEVFSKFGLPKSIIGDRGSSLHRGTGVHFAITLR